MICIYICYYCNYWEFFYFTKRNNYNRILFGKRGTRENTILSLLVLHILLQQASRDVSHELNNMAKFLIRLIENGSEIFE